MTSLIFVLVVFYGSYQGSAEKIKDKENIDEILSDKKTVELGSDAVKEEQKWQIHLEEGIEEEQKKRADALAELRQNISRETIEKIRR